MNIRYCIGIVAVALLLVPASLLASPGVQTTTCTAGPLPGQMTYTFFACTPNITADELRLTLLPSEVGQGEAIVGCAVPALPGMSCSFTATVATFHFPPVGGFQCVPGTPGDADKFVITIATPDGTSLVNEDWYNVGVQKAGFIAVVACPSISVEEQTWGRIKARYE